MSEHVSPEFRKLREDITTAEAAIKAARKRLDVLEEKVAALEKKEEKR